MVTINKFLIFLGILFIIQTDKCYHFSFLFFSVRVANELGKGDAKAAKFAIKVILGVSTMVATIFFSLCLIFRGKISYLFTDDEEVARAVEDLSILLAFSILLNGVYPVLSGK